MSKKKTVEEKIDALALSVAKGFDEVHQRTDGTRKEMRDGFVAVTDRLDKIEFLVTGQERRISILEDKVRQLSTKLGF